MRHGTHAETATVSQVVKRAVAVCDPDASNDLLRLAARAEYGDNPSDEIRDWLQDAGIAL